ncbi:hypothetical protein L1S35_07980 [Flavobacterium sp. AS60]|uniref:hypothetical protein n=1 Tax=Flavobacterium anseongense TaxID=2910677 RepID=UPI001F1C3F25|nr:hypothetical protein [Flavobacterium sp. AS60]MCF6129607.1 hypothetical protein [Flavobacterium sp. AS60]
MGNSTATIEKLFERIEQYSKTSFELYKYSAIYETATLFSSLAVKLVMTMIVFIVVLLFTVALSLWIGGMLQNTVYGFLIMGTFYIVLGIIIFTFRKPWIQTQISNSIINSFDIEKNLKNTDENY